ncbi:MAG: ACP S-malonyltransferase [Candidatus Brocadiia bacterium]
MSSIALLFPGQGAQAVGMGKDLAEASPAAQAVFEMADAELGIALSRLCWDGPPEELSRSDMAQPAILTASVAALHALREAAGDLPPVAAGAGLSLGEYSALVAAGALAFRQAVKLVRARGQFMQDACEENPGTMYSILGMDDESVEQACADAGEGVWPANYNCPGQLVISGRKSAAARAARLCEERGARRAIQLKVAGAFHTPLMQSAADRLAPELERTDFAEPEFPVVANVTARPVREPDEIRRLLVEQVVSPVRWADGMRRVISQGVDEFYEVGPGTVLQGLLRRIDRDQACRSVSDPEQVRSIASDWQKGD